MDKTVFNSNITGRLVNIAEPWNDVAFIPNSLPQEWSLPPTLVQLCSQAREELARLDGAGRYMQDFSLLLTPLKRREALRSSSMEGTFATPEELLMFDLNPVEPKSARDRINDRMEVSNYGRALEFGLNAVDDGRPFSNSLIKALHSELLRSVRGRSKNPGEFRKTQVVVGVGGRYIPPPAIYLDDCLNKLETHQQEDKKIDPLVRAFMAHYQFEAIHPFMDGNGRVGRLLLSLSIYKWLGLFKPWLYMSAFFEKNKDDYIDLLFDVSARGNWEEWIEFCLHGVIEQSKDSLKRVEKFLQLKEAYKSRIQESKYPVRLLKVIDHLFNDHIISVPMVANMCDVSYPTAKSDIEKLVEAKVVGLPTEFSGTNFYVAREILAFAYDHD